MAEHIGQTFRSQHIHAANGDEYVACTFIDCYISHDEDGHFYDCDFQHCRIEVDSIKRFEP